MKSFIISEYISYFNRILIEARNLIRKKPEKLKSLLKKKLAVNCSEIKRKYFFCIKFFIATIPLRNHTLLFNDK